MGYTNGSNIHDCDTTELVGLGLPCKCPITAGSYTLPPHLFNVPKIDGLWSFLASGEYHVRVEFVDTNAGNLKAACFEIDLSLTNTNSGFLFEKRKKKLATEMIQTTIKSHILKVVRSNVKDHPEIQFFLITKYPIRHNMLYLSTFEYNISYDLCDLMGYTNGSIIHDCDTTELIGLGLPCKCPITAGSYTLTPHLFTVPKLSPLWFWLASGDYHVHVEFVDTNAGNHKAACFDIDLSMTGPAFG
ncbi:hypothetical protein KUTeg_006787 [Tegillarca granosa]|uniref:MD-2-related lipid-recognition domain-containing protein n=1 Tax=Tegillarca granosa TaxID=220873 RepID=A0ABQ9FFK4_TEGGR|nr:hypothetical protein KUTeg_006787 [Tegillarca granosa]